VAHSEVGTVCASCASTGLCGGQLATAVPTATNLCSGVPMGVRNPEGNTAVHVSASAYWPRGVRDPRHAEKLQAREPGGPVVARRPCRDPLRIHADQFFGHYGVYGVINNKNAQIAVPKRVPKLHGFGTVCHKQFLARFGSVNYPERLPPLVRCSRGGCLQITRPPIKLSYT
jgi:hypothetical protein